MQTFYHKKKHRDATVSPTSGISRLRAGARPTPLALDLPLRTPHTHVEPEGLELRNGEFGCGNGYIFVRTPRARSNASGERPSAVWTPQGVWIPPCWLGLLTTILSSCITKIYNFKFSFFLEWPFRRRDPANHMSRPSRFVGSSG